MSSEQRRRPVGLCVVCIISVLSLQLGAADSGTLKINSIARDAVLRVTSEIGVTNEFLAVGKADSTNWSLVSSLVVTQSPYLWRAAAGAGASSRFYRVRMPLPSGMVLVPSGSFQMGDALNEGSTDERPVHAVSLSGFYMEHCEVSKALWDAVKNWSTANGYSYDHSGSGKGATHPVHSMNWYDAVKWCNARSQKEGRTPVYYSDIALTQIYKSGQVEPYPRWSADGYRLPTEAEWERAARGGAVSMRFPWGNLITHSNANYNSRTNESYDRSASRGYHPAYANSGMPYSNPGGALPPTGYGLCDLIGNVWEWCWDWYGNYTSGAQTNPRGPATGTKRVNRGGSWFANADGCRVSDRSGLYATNRYDTLGFRTVLPLAVP